MADQPDAMPGDDDGASEPLDRLKSASKALKEKIEEEKRRQTMPIELDARRPGLG